jgi:hypothetical protein
MMPPIGPTNITTIAIRNMVYPPSSSRTETKFTSEFWRALFKRAGTRLAMTAAYHPAADGQSERTNQTVEVAIRCYIAENRAQHEWDELLPDVEYALNTSTNATTGMTPFLMLYGVHPRSDINPSPAENPGAEKFFQDRRRIREEAADTLKVAQAKMAQYFDKKHIPIKVHDKVWLKLASGIKQGYRLPNSTKLDVVKSGPYTVKRKVGKLAYELDLPSHMKIHPVISVVHLEPAVNDPYERTAPQVQPIEVNGEQRWVIDRLVKRERRKKPGTRHLQWYYKVRWAGFDHTHDTWELEEDILQQVLQLVESFGKGSTKRQK